MTRPYRFAGWCAAAMALALLALPAPAQKPPALEQPPKLEPLPEIPPPPNGASELKDSVEPAVTIRQDGDNRIEEFRIHGRLYAIRVTPKIGVPYTMVDPDGTGNFVSSVEHADDPAGRSVRPPRWVLFEF